MSAFDDLDKLYNHQRREQDEAQTTLQQQLRAVPTAIEDARILLRDAARFLTEHGYTGVPTFYLQTQKSPFGSRVVAQHAGNSTMLFGRVTISLLDSGEIVTGGTFPRAAGWDAGRVDIKKALRRLGFDTQQTIATVDGIHVDLFSRERFVVLAGKATESKNSSVAGGVKAPSVFRDHTWLTIDGRPYHRSGQVIRLGVLPTGRPAIAVYNTLSEDTEALAVDLEEVLKYMVADRITRL